MYRVQWAKGPLYTTVPGHLPHRCTAAGTAARAGKEAKGARRAPEGPNGP